MSTAKNTPRPTFGQGKGKQQWVMHLKISEDAGFGGVSRPDAGLATDGEDLMLVEIGGGADIGGDDTVTQAEAIDLDRQQNGQSLVLEPLSQTDGRTPAQALADENQPGRGTFGWFELAIPVAVERAQDQAVGDFEMAIGERLGVDTSSFP